MNCTLFLAAIIIVVVPIFPFALVIVRPHADEWKRIIKVCQVERLGSYCSWLECRPLERVLCFVREGFDSCVVHVEKIVTIFEEKLQEGVLMTKVSDIADKNHGQRGGCELTIDR